ncbi:hypothetical protein I350_00794 [Cryptococcus amylolentus CBS 6273]|uniref:GPI mannosyltransferase 2 n=1 Tax=Cryptococcus amylolentus CBS 6273 TaxID=1296118 RepID=A0A1E3KFZ5_9TREE|nr:hypothetical protein I350_00794 [Cryptococcus amylolentus CBS 6273]
MSILSYFTARSPTAQVFLVALATRIIHLSILHLFTRLVPLFDSSPELLQHSPLPGLRWDAIHFASVASSGYEYEQQVAFQPGWLGVMRSAGEVMRWVRGAAVVDIGDVVLGGTIVANASIIGATVVLYKLSTHIFDPTYAFITCLLYLLPPTAILGSPYTEPLYALLTFTGIYMLAIKEQMFISALFFAGASSIRSTGVFNALFIFAYYVCGSVALDDPSDLRLLKGIALRTAKTMPSNLLVIAPFVAFQWYTSVGFCTSEAMSADTARPWCHHDPPLSYSFVQSLYWNVGPFKYWTLAQLPNIALALPILYSSFLGTSTFLRSFFRSTIFPNPGRTLPKPARPLPELYLVHILTMALLLFASHTQIALRVCLGDPVVWWNVVGLAFEWDKREKGGRLEMTQLGRYWVGWTVVWGSAAMVLWAGHYPPAW